MLIQGVILDKIQIFRGKLGVPGRLRGILSIVAHILVRVGYSPPAMSVTCQTHLPHQPFQRDEAASNHGN